MRISVFLMLVIILILPLLSIASQDVIIEYIEGFADVYRGSSVISADFGLELSDGDRIETAEDSFIIVDLAGRGQIKLLPETSFILEDTGRNISVEITRGGVFSRLQRMNEASFDIRAGSTLAGVRGTEFFTLFGKQFGNEPDVWLCVNEGSVEVSLNGDNDSVTVNAGEGINILAGEQITDPQFYEWTTGLNWNMDPSAGSIIDRTEAGQLYDDLLDVDYD